MQEGLSGGCIGKMRLSLGGFRGRFVAHFVNRLLVLFPRSQLHNPRNPLKILPHLVLESYRFCHYLDCDYAKANRLRI